MVYYEERGVKNLDCLEVIFTPDGYTVDGGSVDYSDILNAAISADGLPPEHPGRDDPGLRFLIRIGELVVDTARFDPDISITREVKPPDIIEIDRLLREMPFVLGAEFVNTGMIIGIYTAIAEELNARLRKYNGTPEEYFKSENELLTVSGRVFFHLVETKEESFPFAFMATYSTKLGGAVTHLQLKRALTEFEGDQAALLNLLGTVSRAANGSALISALVESGELFSPLKFEPADAYEFLKEIPYYEECGIICRIPDFWKRKAKSRIGISLEAKELSIVGMKSLIAFTPDVYFGDTQLDREELNALLGEDEGLAFLKGKWVEVNHKRISQILSAIDNMRNGELTLAEAMRIEAGISSITEPIEGTGVSVTNGAWLSGIIDKMRGAAPIENIPPSSDFEATLRHYQQTGLNWLAYLGSLGFGALLADDMGLGKTVQILALLDKLRERTPSAKTLLIVPASILINWIKESEKFAPKLRVKLLHGSQTDYDRESADLFITTYGMVSRMPKVTADKWDILILDEAQAIKNPSVKQTKAVKGLTSDLRIAMTGTPIENKLSDLWSIFDFLNAGLLGSAAEFKKFSSRLKESPAGYAKLREIVSPFILRRLKTDKSVISDLPDKNEIKQYTTLTKKQVALYAALVRELEEMIRNGEAGEGIERRGKILSAILKFKQICNHPDQYIGQGVYDPKNSGKFETLAEICETIRSKRESVLVFTQFREMCDPLSKYLEAQFERPGLVIHGGTAPKKRGEIVAKFNSEYIPFMVLSLKAGGVGLNLTSANHVVHFDRWWNPAVENQATDRAFRIGQTKDVVVHKFITTGTIEEKIDTIIESKFKIACDIITANTGENWVTEMTDRELLNLFQLEAEI